MFMKNFKKFPFKNTISMFYKKWVKTQITFFYKLKIFFPFFEWMFFYESIYINVCETFLNFHENIFRLFLHENIKHKTTNLWKYLLHTLHSPQNPPVIISSHKAKVYIFWLNRQCFKSSNFHPLGFSCFSFFLWFNIHKNISLLRSRRADESEATRGKKSIKWLIDIWIVFIRKKIIIIGEKFDWHIGSNVHSRHAYNFIMPQFLIVGKGAIRNFFRSHKKPLNSPTKTKKKQKLFGNFVICRDLFLKTSETHKIFPQTYTRLIVSNPRENLIKRKFHHLPLWLFRMSSSNKSKLEIISR